MNSMGRAFSAAELSSAAFAVSAAVLAASTLVLELFSTLSAPVVVACAAGSSEGGSNIDVTGSSGLPMSTGDPSGDLLSAGCCGICICETGYDGEGRKGKE